MIEFIVLSRHCLQGGYQSVERMIHGRLVSMITSPFLTIGYCSFLLMSARCKTFYYLYKRHLKKPELLCQLRGSAKNKSSPSKSA